MPRHALSRRSWAGDSAIRGMKPIAQERDAPWSTSDTYIGAVVMTLEDTGDA